MKLYNMKQVNEFKDIVNNATGKVWVEDGKGSSFDLKSELSQYRVIGEMLNHPENDLELYASDYNDEIALMSFLMRTRQMAA